MVTQLNRHQSKTNVVSNGENRVSQFPNREKHPPVLPDWKVANQLTGDFYLGVGRDPESREVRVSVCRFQSCLSEVMTNKVELCARRVAMRLIKSNFASNSFSFAFY